MTKAEILAAAGYPNTPQGIAAFYRDYPNPEDWFNSQQQMAYGGGNEPKQKSIRDLAIEKGIKAEHYDKNKEKIDAIYADIRKPGKYSPGFADKILISLAKAKYPNLDQIITDVDAGNFAYGGMPDIMGVPFGAGITMAHGGTYYGGPIYPAQKGTAVPAMDPDAWEKQYGKPAVSGFNEPPKTAVKFPTLNTRSSYEKFKASNPNFARYSDADMEGLGVNVPPVFKPAKQNTASPYTSAGTTAEGYGLFKNPQGQQFIFSQGKYSPYPQGVAVKMYGGLYAPGGPTNPPLDRATFKGTPQEWTDYHIKAGYEPEYPASYKEKTAMGAYPGFATSSWTGQPTPATPQVVNQPPVQPPITTINTPPQYIPQVQKTKKVIRPVLGAKYGGLPYGANEMPCYNCGGFHMETGGDVHDKPGGSNVGKKTFADGSPRTGPYVGPSGGAPAGSYPVPDIKHARAALSLAHNAPNPSGIKEAVYKKYPSLRKQTGGSMTPDLQGQYPIFGYGGYDSPFNYGQFPAMQGGGDPTALWLAQEQMAIMNKTKSGIPSGATPTGINPLNYNPFLKGSDIAQPDSMHTSPYNPNIAAYFKGNKVIAGPATDTGAARKDAMMLNRGKMLKKDNEIWPNYIQNYKAHGGDLTSQGGNQDFLNNRTSTYMNYIQNNVLKNMHEEESQNVENAFNQMEYGYHQMPDGSMMPNNMMQYGAQLNPQNAALQDMYAQNINQYKDRSRRDFQSFADMTTDFLGQVTAQEGRVMMPNWEYSNYIPQNDIRTGYALGKSDYAKLAKLQGQGKVTGAKFNYGTLGRFMPRVFGPKSIEIGYINPNKGMFEDLKEPLKFDSPAQSQDQQSTKSYDDMNWFQKRRENRRVAGQEKDAEERRQRIAEIGPEAYKEEQAWKDMSWGQKRGVKKAMKANLREDELRNKRIEETKNATGIKEGDYYPENLPMKSMKLTNFMSSQFQNPSGFDSGRSMQDAMDSGENYIMRYQNAYGGLFKAQKGKSTPISMDEWQESLRFKAPIVDDSEDVQVPSMDTSPIKEQTEAEAFADVAGIQKRRQEQRDLFGPPMDDKPDLFASDSITAKKKTTGVGRFLGKNAPLIADTISSVLESKENRKNEQKMKDLMMADNAFLTTPMNAKNRGDYDPNSGMFRPDDMVPVQFPGYAQWGGFNTMAFGGGVSEGEELDLTPEEIDELRQQGYEIEYLD